MNTIKSNIGIKHEYYSSFQLVPFVSVNQSFHAVYTLLGLSFKNSIPHIIATRALHESAIECLQFLAKKRFLRVTFITPDVTGNILASVIEENILPDTFLISVPFAHYETGTLLNVLAISETCHKVNIPLHVDATMAIGIEKINMVSNGIDILHYASPNTSCVIYNNDVLRGYSIMFPMWNQGNETKIHESYLHNTIENFEFRNTTQQKMLQQKIRFLRELYTQLPIVSIDTQSDGICFMGDQNIHNTLANFVTIAIIKIKGKPFSNKEFTDSVNVQHLELSTGYKYNRYVYTNFYMSQLDLPLEVRRGLIRITFLNADLKIAQIVVMAQKIIKKITSYIDVTQKTQSEPSENTSTQTIQTNNIPFANVV